MPRKRRNFSPEVKFRVAMEFLTGQKRRVDILREVQLSDSTLVRWCGPIAASTTLSPRPAKRRWQHIEP